MDAKLRINGTEPAATNDSLRGCAYMPPRVPTFRPTTIRPTTLRPRLFVQ